MCCAALLKIGRYYSPWISLNSCLWMLYDWLYLYAPHQRSLTGKHVCTLRKGIRAGEVKTCTTHSYASVHRTRRTALRLCVPACGSMSVWHRHCLGGAHGYAIVHCFGCKEYVARNWATKQLVHNGVGEPVTAGEAVLFLECVTISPHLKSYRAFLLLLLLLFVVPNRGL